MAKNKFTFEKRRRELDKKAKKEARKQLKEEKKAQAAPGTQDGDASVPDTGIAEPAPAQPGADSPA